MTTTLSKIKRQVRSIARRSRRKYRVHQRRLMAPILRRICARKGHVYHTLHFDVGCWYLCERCGREVAEDAPPNARLY